MPPADLAPGDFFISEGDEWHWHGALPDKPGTFLSVTLEPPEWTDESVVDSVYERAPEGSG